MSFTHLIKYKPRTADLLAMHPPPSPIQIYPFSDAEGLGCGCIKLNEAATRERMPGNLWGSRFCPSDALVMFRFLFVTDIKKELVHLDKRYKPLVFFHFLFESSKTSLPKCVFCISVDKELYISKKSFLVSLS